MELSEFHVKQLTQFLTFMRVKRRQHVKEIELEVETMRKAVRKENVFNQDEVLQLLAITEEKTRDCVLREIEHNTHVSTLLVKNLFMQAENEGFSLQADTNCLEDSTLLSEIARMEETGANAGVSVSSEGPSLKLASLAPRPLMPDATAHLAEIEALKTKLSAAEGKANHLLAELKEGMRDRVELNSKVKAQELELKALRSHESPGTTIPIVPTSGSEGEVSAELRGRGADDHSFRSPPAEGMNDQSRRGEITSTPSAHPPSAEVGRLLAQIEDLREQAELRNLELTHAQQQLADSSMEANVKAAQMKQFKQMRDILERKNVKLANFRLRLSRYEVLDLDEP